MKKKYLLIVMIGVLIFLPLLMVNNPKTQTDTNLIPSSSLEFGDNSEMDVYFDGNGTDGSSWENAYVIEDLIIDETDFYLDIHNTDSYLIIRNVTFRHAYSHDNLINITDSSNIRIENCNFTDPLNIVINISGDSENIQIINNIFETDTTIPDSLLYVEGTEVTNIVNVTFKNNIIDIDQVTDFIRFYYTDNITMQNNTISTPSSVNLIGFSNSFNIYFGKNTISDSSSIVFGSMNCKNVTIEENSMTSSALNFFPIGVVNSEYIDILSNEFENTQIGSGNSAMNGTQITNCNYTRIEDNIIKNFQSLLVLDSNKFTTVVRNDFMDVGDASGSEKTFYITNGINETFVNNSFSNTDLDIQSNCQNVTFLHNYYEGFDYTQPNIDIRNVTLVGGSGYINANFTLAGGVYNDTQPLMYEYGLTHVTFESVEDSWNCQDSTKSFLWNYYNLLRDYDGYYGYDNSTFQYDMTIKNQNGEYVVFPVSRSWSSGTITNDWNIWTNPEVIDSNFLYDQYIFDEKITFRVEVYNDTNPSITMYDYYVIDVLNEEPEVVAYQEDETWYIGYGKDVMNFSVFDNTAGANSNPIRYELYVDGELNETGDDIGIGVETNITIPIFDLVGTTEYRFVVNDSAGGLSEVYVYIEMLDQVLFTVTRSGAVYNLIEGVHQYPTVYYNLIEYAPDLVIEYVTDYNGQFIDGEDDFQGSSVSYDTQNYNLQHGYNEFEIAFKTYVNGKQYIVFSRIVLNLIKIPLSPTLVTQNQTIENGNITIDWNPVFNSERYLVYINDEYFTNTTSTDLDLSFTTEGTYVIKIYSYNEAGNSTLGSSLEIIYDIPEEEDETTIDDIMAKVAISVGSILGAGGLGLLGYAKVFKPRKICIQQGKKWNWKKFKC